MTVTTVTTVTLFRQSLSATLSELLEVPFVGGPVTAAQDGHDLGCVWLQQKTPFGRDGNIEQITYGVRLFRVWVQAQGSAETGRNVELLEQDVEVLQVALKAVLTTAGHDFFQVASVIPNYADQYVEATLIAFQRNLGAAGG